MTGPQQPYGYGPQPGYRPPRPRRSGLPVWLVLVLVAAGLLVVLLVLATCAALVTSSGTGTGAAASAVPTVPTTATPVGEAPSATGPTGPLQHPEDVTVVACGQDGTIGWGQAQVAVTNNSSKASAYSIKIAFESPDGAVLHAEGYAYVSRLEPGQTTMQDVSALGEVPADVACRLTGAQRTAA